MSECGDGDRYWSVLEAHQFLLDVLKYLSAAVMIYLSLLTLTNQIGGSGIERLTWRAYLSFIL